MEKHWFFMCKKLHKILKERIKGGIFISMDDGVLTVNINAGRGIRYRRNITEVPRDIDVEHLAEQITLDYKMFLNNRFFIDQRREEE